MESRKITVISTKNQRKSVIMSSAETLGELKVDLRNEGIDYSNMVFYEGTSKTSSEKDDSILPKNVPFKGNVTNELVFMLTNPEKKIKSGSIEARLALYDQIKNLGIAEAIKAKYGKIFTTLKSEILSSEIEAVSPKKVNKKAPKKATVAPIPENEQSSKVVADVKTKVQPIVTKPCLGEKAINVLKTLTNILLDNGTLEDCEADTIFDMLNDNVEATKLQSSYSDDELANMFADAI